MKRTKVILCGLMVVISTLLFFNAIGSVNSGTEIIKITSPENEEELSGTVEIELEVLACFCDGKTTLYVDGEFVSGGTRTGMSDDGKYEIFVHEWDSSSVKDGKHRIRVYDKHDDTYDEIYVNVENADGEEPPFVYVSITEPDDESQVEGIVTVTAEVPACFCNGKTSLFVDDKFVTEGTRTAMSDDGYYEIFTHQWDSSDASDGEHTIKVYDKHDDHSDEITVMVDNDDDVGPEENIRIISPEDNAQVKGDVTVTAEVMICNCTGTTSLYVDNVFITDGTPGRMTADGKYQIYFHIWDSTTVADGTHNVKVYGKHDDSSDEIGVVVDNGGGGGQPVPIRIIAPDDNDKVEGVVDIKAEVPACFCDGKTSLYVDGKFISEGVKEGMSEDGIYEIFIHEWDSSKVSNGGHKITVIDKHDDHSDSIAVFVNNAGSGTPEKRLRIISPQNDDRIGGKITIKVEMITVEPIVTPRMYVNDRFVSEGQLVDDIEYDGEVYYIYSIEWDTSSVTNGDCSLRIQEGHNGDYDEVQLHVENEGGIIDDVKDTEVISSGTTALSAILLLIGMVGLITIMVKLRK